VALQAITVVLGALDQALAQISLSLVSGNTDAPGVYEGLDALTDGLTATINGLVKLSNGAAESAGGADQLATGTQDLTDGLNELADGAQDLAQGSADLADGAGQLAQGSEDLAQGTSAQADATRAVGDALSQVDQGVDSAAGGADQLADGAGQLQEEGTQEVLASVVKASKDPALAKAYLAASQSRAADALPYGAPDGAAGRVAYIYTLPGSQESDTASSLAGWGLLAVIAAAAGAVAWRRLHPADAAQPVVEPEPPATDDDWPFRPQ
jgi:putative membrane protein